LFGGPAYNDLKVTWAINPLNFWRFNSLPRQQSDAEAQGWTLFKDGCSVAKSSLPGKRFILNGDLSAMLSYDQNGYIAGIQMGVPKNATTPGHLTLAAPLINDGTNYVISAYFVHPSRICDKSKSRTADEFSQQGTVDKVFLQAGPNAATDIMEIPLTQDENALTAQKWVKGKCFPTMGQHYWWDVSEDMNCDKMMPFCLLYNSGKFNGFCFAMNDYFTNANPHRFEHPSNSEAKLCCLDPYPKCFDQITNKFSTMHVYLDSTPLLNFC
jgi:charged multivesicular body protein 7